MTDFDNGAISILDYIITRGEKLLDSDRVTDDMALGIALILGLAKAKRNSLEEDFKNARQENNGIN